jgi:hypothetical protein
MSRALAWIRKSKGSEDDIGLEEQRERVAELAEQVADRTDTLDLGIQSGFSTLTRDPDASTTWIDQNERVVETVEELKAGEYDDPVAYDDRRVCCDVYLAVIVHAATQGDCEFVYAGDVQDDDLAFDIQRRVERQTKEEEIEKSQAALERRREQGYDHGRPRFGMEYDDAGEYQVPGDEFDTVLEILRLRRLGNSYPEIAEETEVPVSTARRVVERREWYVERTKLAEN